MTTPGQDPMVVIARDMRALPMEARKGIRPALRKIGRMIAREAAVRSSWSSRIPATIKVSTSFAANREGVTIRAGGRNAPHARPYEGLSAGGRTFRHPVYGHDVWVTQAARPFLFPAVQTTESTVSEAIREVLDAAAAGIGFH